LNYGNVNIRKNFPENVGNKVKFKFSNLKNINCDDNYFDSIIDFHTLEHIYPEDLNQVICEKYRILKHGGHIILSIPYEKAFHSPTEIVPQHVNFFNETKLKKSFELNKFETIECYKDDRIGNSPESWCLTAIFKKVST
jgi:SAM-dependent methyltransferase